MVILYKYYPSVNLYLEQSTPLLLFLPWTLITLSIWHLASNLVSGILYTLSGIWSLAPFWYLASFILYLYLASNLVSGSFLLPWHPPVSSFHVILLWHPSVTSFCGILPLHPSEASFRDILYPSTPSYFILFSHLIQRVLNLPFSPTRILIISIHLDISFILLTFFIFQFSPTYFCIYHTSICRCILRCSFCQSVYIRLKFIYQKSMSEKWIYQYVLIYL